MSFSPTAWIKSINQEQLSHRRKFSRTGWRYWTCSNEIMTKARYNLSYLQSLELNEITENHSSPTDLAALWAGRVVWRHVALEGISRVEVGRVADGGVREVGRRGRGQDGRGRELQGRVWRGAPRRYNWERDRQEDERRGRYRLG